MENKKGLLIILSGPSGVGKGTVRKIVMRDKSLNLVYSISMTTRLPREKEVEGKDYFFVSKEVFDENIKNNNLLEYAEFVGNKYGTPRDYVERLRNEGKNVILEIEVNGAQQVLSKTDKDDRISIFLVPPSIEELESRIRHRRSEEEDIIQQRLNKAKREMSLTDQYDYVVLNDKVGRAAGEIKSIIRKNLKK
ncbi:MAG: guanylate kinase [Erysipelotrichales bacterium]|nr:guanylate kinase [Erysipelotrichales bacterium]